MTDRYRHLFEKAGELANDGQYYLAGQAILDGLNIAPNQASTLDAKGKKLAYLAATYFTKSNDLVLAVELYLALGERSKAAEYLEKSGDVLGAQKVREGRLGRIASLSGRSGGAVGGEAVTKYTAQRLENEGKVDLAVKAYIQVRAYADAGRLLRAQGKLQDAANVYAEGGKAFEAGHCFFEIGDVGKALENYVRVPRDHKYYRHSALQVIAMAVQVGQMTFQIDNFLAEFIRTAPRDAQELEALYQLGGLFESQDFLSNAKEIFQKIFETNSQYKDVQARMERLQRFSNPSAAVYEKIRAQEAGFRGEQRRIDPKAFLKLDSSQPMPDLPPLPDLPELPELPELNPLPSAANASVSAKPGFSGTIAAVRAQALSSNPAHAPTIPPPPSKEEFMVGNTIANRYMILEEIGRGGMAAVFRAEDQELEEEIALKVFLTQISDPAALQESEARFKQELKLSRKLIHKNIIRLYDIGIHYGHRYISMELLHGKDLEQRLSLLNAPMDFAKGIYLMIQACAGLHVAHEHGVVHRDIKPENLFVTNNGVLKVMDFGIAKNTVTPGMTVEGMLAGTPHYIAPEQISSFSKVTHSADLYALGVVMYKMFTGQLPFDNEDMTKLLMMHINHPVTPPGDLNPHIPKELQKIIGTLLKKNPGQRYKDAKETAAHLKQVYLQITSG